MSDIQVPDCFCHGADDCKWQVEVMVKMSHMENVNATTSTVPWKLDNIPQPLAQVILQSSVDVINKNGAEAYKEWLLACVQDPNHPVYKMTKQAMDNQGLKLP